MNLYLQKGYKVTYCFYKNDEINSYFFDVFKKRNVNIYHLKNKQSKQTKFFKIFINALFNATHNTFFYYSRLIKVLPSNYLKILFNNYISYFLFSFIKINFLKKLQQKVPYKTSTELSKIIAFEKPSIIFVSPGNIREAPETEILFSKKIQNIKKVLLILSWDATTTKGLYDDLYDYIFTWNDKQIDDLLKLHKIKKTKNIFSVGSLYHEWNFDKLIINKKAIKFKNHKILWLGSSANICPNEKEIFETFYKKLSKLCVANKINTEIELRTHPSNVFRTSLNIKVVKGKLKVNSKENIYKDLFKYSCVVGINTTAMLDTSFLGLKVFALKVINKNIRQNNTKHFKRFLEFGNIEFTSEENICNYLKNLKVEKKQSIKNESFYQNVSKKIFDNLETISAE